MESCCANQTRNHVAQLDTVLYLHTYIHIYIYTYIHTYIHTYICTYVGAKVLGEVVLVGTGIYA